MYKIIFAVYDSTAGNVPDKFVQKVPYTIYRSKSESFIDDLSAKGYETSAVLREDDIAALKEGTFTHEGLQPNDIEFLTKHLALWEWNG